MAWHWKTAIGTSTLADTFIFSLLADQYLVALFWYYSTVLSEWNKVNSQPFLPDLLPRYRCLKCANRKHSPKQNATTWSAHNVQIFICSCDSIYRPVYFCDIKFEFDKMQFYYFFYFLKTFKICRHFNPALAPVFPRFGTRCDVDSGTRQSVQRLR